MIKVATGTVLAAVLALAGCAAPQPQPGAAPHAVAAAPLLDEEAPPTGSHLVKRKGTDRMLKTVGAQDARDALDSVPDPMKAQ